MQWAGRVSWVRRNCTHVAAFPTSKAVGFVDPFNPYEAVLYLAQEFSAGRSRAWSCA
jgi:hypothetical protein